MKNSITFVRVVKLLPFLLFLTGAAYGQTWSTLGSGANNDIYASIVYNNQLVVAGNFTTAGGSTANRIAVWNGASWSTLGTGFDNKVYALAVYNGNLIAGGSFGTAGGVSVNRIAMWNGTSWSALGSGIDNGQVNALTVYSGNLVAAGTFTLVNGITMDRIAKWNGSAWSVLANGLGNEVDALTLYNGNLIVGGKFTTAGVPNSARIVMWNGTGWSALGSGIDNGQVNALQVYNGNLITGGSFTAIGGISYDYIAQWNGSAWSGLSSGVNNDVYALNIYLGDVYAGGKFTTAGSSSANLIAKWNGVSWSALGTGISGTGQAQVNSITPYNGLLNAGGNFNTAGGISASNIAKWGSAPVSPTLISPANNSTEQSLTLTLDWSDVENASSYGVQVSTTNTFTTTVVNVSGLSASQYTVPGGLLSDNTTYYWRANASNGLGASSYSSYWQFTTTSFIAPTLVSPLNNSIGQNLSLSLVWTKSPNAVSYKVQLALDSSFVNMVVNDSTVTDSTYTVSNLIPLTYYWWRVNAKNASQEISPYSAVYNFRTIGTPYPVTLSYPANNSTNLPVSLTFLWNNTTEQMSLFNIVKSGKKKFGAESINSFWFELVTDTITFSGMIRDTTISDTLKAVSGLNYQTRYFWRVKAKNQAGWGNFSAWFNFTTAGAPPALVNLTVIPAGFYDQSSGLLNFRDTVLVILVDPSNCTPVDSARVTVDSVTFSASLSFSQASTGNYYIYVVHRNHLTISSRLAQTITRGSLVSYDFTTDSSKTYGFNAVKVSDSPVRWGMIPGDANQDGYVDGLDQSIWVAQNGENGYFSADFNGDTYVDGLDQSIWMMFNGNSTALPCYFSRVLKPFHAVFKKSGNGDGINNVTLDSHPVFKK